MTADQLTPDQQAAVDRWHRAEKAREVARVGRLRAVVGMRETGMAWGQIERATGMTRQYLHRLAVEAADRDAERPNT